MNVDEIEFGASRRSIAIALAVVAALLFLSNVTYYFPFFCDDGFISLRYSKRLLEGQGLTWTDGEYVEGYSNLSYVLLSSFFGIFIDLISAARLVGALGTTLLFWAIYKASGKHELQISTALVWCLLSATEPIVVWTIGGLEATLYAGAITLGYVQWFRTTSNSQASIKSLLFATWPLALACWTRPDAPIFVVALVLSHIVAEGYSARGIFRAGCAAVVPFSAFCAQLIFRLFYYGDWVPNTARIKTEANFHRFKEGIQYLWSAFDSSTLLLALTCLGLYAAIVGKYRRREIFSCCFAIYLWALYVARIGGDIFPAWRHAVPIYALLSLCIFYGLEWFISRSRNQQKKSIGNNEIVIIAVAVAGILAYRWAQRSDVGNRRAFDERWEWGAEPLGKIYRTFLPRDPVMAIEPAGALPYFSELRGIDMFGLNDRHIARSRAHAGRMLAHDHGDGEYLWKRQPDLIVFAMPWGGGPISVTGSEMIANPAYHSKYENFSFLGIDPYDVLGQVAVNKEGRLWIQKTENSISIPGYLFSGYNIVGHRTVGGQTGALVTPGGFGNSPEVELDEGLWSLTVEGRSSWSGVEIRNLGSEPLRWVSFEDSWYIQGHSRLSVIVRSGARVSTEFSGISFVRQNNLAPPQLTHTIAPGETSVLQQAKTAWSSEAVAEKPYTKGFYDKSGERMGARLQARPECETQLPGIDAGNRIDTYDLGEQDLWTGDALGPVYDTPENALALVCLSGAKHSAGVRLRDLQSGDIIRTWTGEDSLGTKTHISDLGPYAGRRLRFEAYDRRRDAWGHVRVYGVGIVKATFSKEG